MRVFFSTQTAGEIVARVVHAAIGLYLIGVSLWFLFSVSPFNPYGFFGFLVIGAIPLGVALKGDRRTVFLVLLLGWL